MTTTPAHPDTTPGEAAFLNALADRNRQLTKRLVLATAGLAALIIIPMTTLGISSWVELETSDDPWAGFGIVIAIFFSVPVVVGALVAVLGLIWASKTAGPVVAGIGLGINAVAVLLIAWTWFPAVGI